MGGVLEDPRRIGDDNTESVEPNSKVVVVFHGNDIHGQPADLTTPQPQLSIAWIGKNLWWGGTSFNAPAPVLFSMAQISDREWRYTFQMIGYLSFGAPSGAQFLCVEATITHGSLAITKMRYCIPPQRSDDHPGLARRRFPRRRLIPTADKTKLAQDSCRR